MISPPRAGSRAGFARDLVAATRPWLLDWFAAGLTVDTKADRTPVTEADVAMEQHIRQQLLARFPEDGFYGEETGRLQGDGRWQWLLDPIDGTRSFTRGYGFFSTQLAAMQDAQLVLGVSQAPVSDELLWAEQGGGAWQATRRLQVSSVERLDCAHVSFGNINSMAAEPAAWARLAKLIGACERHRGYGDYLHYHLLAQGCIDVVLESDVSILDIAALTVIIREAGGVVSDMQGNPVGLTTTSIVAANPSLHAQVLAMLNEGRE